MTVFASIRGIGRTKASIGPAFRPCCHCPASRLPSQGVFDANGVCQNCPRILPHCVQKRRRLVVRQSSSFQCPVSQSVKFHLRKVEKTTVQHPLMDLWSAASDEEDTIIPNSSTHGCCDCIVSLSQRSSCAMPHPLHKSKYIRPNHNMPPAIALEVFFAHARGEFCADLRFSRQA